MSQINPFAGIGPLGGALNSPAERARQLRQRQQAQAAQRPEETESEVELSDAVRAIDEQSSQHHTAERESEESEGDRDESESGSAKKAHIDLTA